MNRQHKRTCLTSDHTCRVTAIVQHDNHDHRLCVQAMAARSKPQRADTGSDVIGLVMSGNNGSNQKMAPQFVAEARRVRVH